MKIYFIADFFLNEILGGGELNNHELIKILRKKQYLVETINSHLVTPKWIKERDNFIVANFVNLSEESKKTLLNKKYLIYEHDHKYIKSRNPGLYDNFIAPKQQIINLEFYRKASAVLCQSSFHLKIIKNNIGITNLINLSGNLWSISSLEFMKKINNSNDIKSDKFCILDSNIAHKNTQDAIKYCKIKKYDYILVSDSNYYNFLRKMGRNKTFIFFPKSPETLSRITVEARMMNMKTITNNKVGASQEPWFKLKGDELIDRMFEKRQTITNTVVEFLND